jgi:hypothetical protein
VQKVDLAKRHKKYYSAARTPEVVHIEPAEFLAITGKGDPSGPAFLERIQALYSTAYTLKFQCKAQGRDFVVAKLEGLWWYDETKHGSPSMADTARNVPRNEWEYRLLIRMPECVSEPMVAACAREAAEKKELPLARSVEFLRMAEGTCVQMLHVGPFSTEPETLARMWEFIASKRFAKNGLHHEIYLSDFRKTAPEKLKTILREPVKAAS